MNTLKPLIIGAPFGNWFSHPDATSTLGTFTYKHRAGFVKRLWRVSKTLRYRPALQGWTNKLGLPNEGIGNVDLSVIPANQIISIHGFDTEDWDTLFHYLYNYLPYNKPAIELNCSCPNVTDKHLNWFHIFAQARKRFANPIIVKLPPLRWHALVKPAIDAGLTYFHACNTIPVPCGGLSGKTLKQYSLWAIEEIKEKYPQTVIIGGGGICNTNDVQDYFKAGANHVAIASCLLNPFTRRSRLNNLSLIAQQESLYVNTNKITSDK